MTYRSTLSFLRQPENNFQLFIPRIFDFVQWILVVVAIRFVTKKTHSADISRISSILQVTLWLYVLVEGGKRLPDSQRRPGTNVRDYVIVQVFIVVAMIIFSIGGG